MGEVLKFGVKHERVGPEARLPTHLELWHLNIIHLGQHILILLHNRGALFHDVLSFPTEPHDLLLLHLVTDSLLHLALDLELQVVDDRLGTRFNLIGVLLKVLVKFIEELLDYAALVKDERATLDQVLTLLDHLIIGVGGCSHGCRHGGHWITAAILWVLLILRLDHRVGGSSCFGAIDSFGRIGGGSCYCRI